MKQLPNYATEVEFPEELQHIGDKTGPRWRAISAGRNHQLAINEDDELYAWRNNDRNQLALSTLCKPSFRRPANDLDDAICDHIVGYHYDPEAEKWQAVEAGNQVSYAIDEYGRLWS